MKETMLDAPVSNWMECFRVVDNVFTKVVQIQQLHMDLIWFCCTFQDVGMRKDFAEKQRKECKQLQEDIISLKKNMIERFDDTAVNQNLSILSRQSEPNVLPFTEIVTSPSGSELIDIRECDIKSEIKRDDNSKNRDRETAVIEDTQATKDNADKAKVSAINESPKSDPIVINVYSDPIPTDYRNFVEFPFVKTECTKNESDGFRKTEPYLPEEDETVSEMEQNTVNANQTEVFKEDWNSSVEDINPDIANQLQTTRINANEGLPCRSSVTKHVDKDESQIGEETSFSASKSKSLATSAEHQSLASMVCEKIANSLRNEAETHILSKVYDRYCDCCGKAFADKESILQHIMEFAGERPYTCVICGKKFSLETLLNAHMETHCCDEMPFQCTLCRKRFPNNSLLRYHVVRIHGSVSKTPHVCILCGREFKEKKSLNKHIVEHGKEKRYMCGHCEKRFHTKDTLRMHMRIHNSEKPFGCEICEKRFRHIGSLNEHKWVHAGEGRASMVKRKSSYGMSLRRRDR